MTLNIAADAPMPIASVSSAVSVSDGERRSRRTVCRTMDFLRR
jgi:hypothetical protein